MIVGVTGTRDGMSQKQFSEVSAYLDTINITEFHHGDCVGVDAEMHEIIRDRFPDAKIVIHPPQSDYLQAHCIGDESRKPAPYIERDQNNVNAVDHLIGIPLTPTYKRGSGTWFTIEYAKKTGMEPKVILP